MMSSHLNKRTSGSQSQILPPPARDVASDVTQTDRYVLLCDWHGRVVWKSGTGDRVQVGDELWNSVAGNAKEALKTAVASVATLRENRVVEAENDRGEHFRLWMWPLADPEFAICILAMAIPGELALLTERERACLRCLAQGHSTRTIAKELNIGLTTVHTHLRRAREKLGLASGEVLIGYAARYFFAPPAMERNSPATRIRSG
jgi:DNA-binding CsgD family transcriptional regulator